MHATIHTGVRASQVTARRARVLCRCSVYQWKPITVNSTIHEIISDGRETRNRNQEKEKKENVVEEFPSRRASSFELILFRVPLVNSSQPLNRSTVTIFVAFYLFVILMVSSLRLFGKSWNCRIQWESRNFEKLEFNRFLQTLFSQFQA